MTEDQKLERVIHFAMQAYDFDNGELALTMFNISRSAQTQITRLSLPDALAAEVFAYFTGLLPEITKRLCKAEGIHVAIPTDPTLSNLSDEELRSEFAKLISSEGYRKLTSVLAEASQTHDTIRALDVATASIANGNIYAIGLDRLCIGPLDDALSSIVSVTSMIRGVNSVDGRWFPAISMSTVDVSPPKVDRNTITAGIVMTPEDVTSGSIEDDELMVGV